MREIEGESGDWIIYESSSDGGNTWTTQYGLGGIFWGSTPGLIA